LFNVVTNTTGTPHAVLIRAARSFDGSELMHKRRDKRHGDKSLLAGPGSLSQALGITTDLTGINLLGDQIWIEDHKIAVAAEEITTGPRVGIDYAEEDATRPYRFIVDRPSP
jgi:DNA-3-methyladenine glycosylase